MSQHLFFASTPFNMLTASMVAFSLPDGDEKTLWLIDQPDNKSMFIQALKDWNVSPFTQIKSISKKVSGQNKAKARRNTLKIIDAQLELLTPTKIYTGNDRRIEFQYAMAKSTSPPIGVYLDDGTYTYLGRKTSWIKDHLIDNIIKKLVYGCWWKQPVTIGASGWINEVYAAFPDFVCSPLQTKQIYQLPLNLQRSEFSQLSLLCLNDKQLINQISSVKGLILLPHDSVANRASLNMISEWAQKLDGNIAIKHHPRTTDKSVFSSIVHHYSFELPTQIPMEVMLPLLSTSCAVAGDVSTALLTSKWLRPDLKVCAVGKVPQEPEWINLLQALNIEIL